MQIGPARSDVVVEDVDGRICLYVPATDSALLLDDSGSAVWRLVADGTTWDELLAALTAATGTPEQELRGQVEPLLEQLRVSGALPPA